MFQELRVDRAYIHPNWTGNVTNGSDVALLRLPRKVNARLPVLASEDIELYANMRIHGFKFGPVIEMAEFQVVAKQHCPLLNLSSNNFCAFSTTASMHSGRGATKSKCCH